MDVKQKVAEQPDQKQKTWVDYARAARDRLKVRGIVPTTKEEEEMMNAL